MGASSGHQVEDEKPSGGVADGAGGDGKAAGVPNWAWAGGENWDACAGDCLNIMKTMNDESVDLVIGSPPYCGKMRRYIGGKERPLSPKEWASWMADVVMESTRISSGYAIFVVNGSVRGGRYNAATERLIVECDDRGLVCERPAIWHKNAPPNRRDWFGNDWESIVAFKDRKKPHVWNWEAIGTPPKFTNGGRFRQRTETGERRLGNEYPTGKLARPRDVLRVTVGGGHLGWSGASENEAPFPIKLIEPFIKALTNPGGTVCDPFLGSGSTLHAAVSLGRLGIGFDSRQSQVELTKRRMEWLAAQ